MADQFHDNEGEIKVGVAWGLVHEQDVHIAFMARLKKEHPLGWESLGGDQGVKRLLRVLRFIGPQPERR